MPDAVTNAGGDPNTNANPDSHTGGDTITNTNAIANALADTGGDPITDPIADLFVHTHIVPAAIPNGRAIPYSHSHPNVGEHTHSHAVATHRVDAFGHAGALAAGD